MFESLPPPHPPAEPRRDFSRGLPASSALDWLAAGWADLRGHPGPSLAYGLLLTALSYAVLLLLHAAGLLYLAFPAISAGIYGWPMDDAARIAVETVRAAAEEVAETVRTVLFVPYGSAAEAAFRTTLG